MTMLKSWLGRNPIAEPLHQEEFETQQMKLARLSGDLLVKYRQDLDLEVNDPGRLATLYGSNFATAEVAKQAELVAVMASQMLDAPNALVTIVLPDRQQTIARVAEGHVVDNMSTPIEDSYCANVIATGREFSVEDSLEHPLVCDTKFAREGEIVSYLGVPIANREAIIIGVLCVYDDEVRYWNAADVGILTQLSLVLTRTAS